MDAADERWSAWIAGARTFVHAASGKKVKASQFFPNVHPLPPAVHLDGTSYAVNGSPIYWGDWIVADPQVAGDAAAVRGYEFFGAYAELGVELAFPAPEACSEDFFACAVVDDRARDEMIATLKSRLPKFSVELIGRLIVLKPRARAGGGSHGGV